MTTDQADTTEQHDDLAERLAALGDGELLEVLNSALANRENDPDDDAGPAPTSRKAAPSATGERYEDYYPSRAKGSR